MRMQTQAAVENADVALFVVDARAGITPLDEEIARWLREGDAPVVLMANKAEGKAGDDGVMEAFSLGLGDPVPFSAEHGQGLRSEEHTSELQSLMRISYAVFCLKKKKH